MMVGNPFSLPCHPLGVKPAGNAFTNARQIYRPLEPLNDEILVSILELLDTPSLLAIGATCRVLYAFSRFDELWRTKAVGLGAVPHQWNGTWRASFLGIPPGRISQVSADGLASDVLYRPFLCAKTPLTPYISRIPEGNQIPRLKDVAYAEFSKKWADKPFILTEPVTEWPIFSQWSTESLLKRYGDVVFRAEAVDWPLSTYVSYMENNSDESPLYLFDRMFVEKMKLNTGKDGDFWTPDCFGDDLFALLGDQRPDSRWLIIGPERSGSTFHKDPNATSAWNAVIEGSKYWIMFPSGSGLPSPPGIFVSPDQSEVTSPLSIAEWLLGFHKEARSTPGCKEGICRAGELVHVPSGWWHLVVNIEPSIAVTQNFVPDAHLREVLLFLRDKSSQISGFREGVHDPFSLFKDVLERNKPERVQKVLASMEKRHQKKRKWEELISADYHQETEHHASQGGFSFGFANND